MAKSGILTIKSMRTTASHLLLLLFAGTFIAADSATRAPLPPDAKYTGPGSCSSPSCHGGVQPRQQSSVLQNEYSTWVLKDKHTKAFAALTTPIGKRMGQILGLAHPEAEQKCLVCHSLNVAADMRSRSFDVDEGVSCENCHGPASKWLGPHTEDKWTHAQSVQAGMHDNRDLIQRTEKCLECHLGTAHASVDHQMIAAGHPDLYFELDSFSAAMPRHWKEPVDKDPWISIRTLGVGQAVQLRENLQRVARRAQGPVWPEYSELDCFACHHNLTAAKDSWRQQRGYPERSAGNPPFNLSRYAVFEKFANEVDRNASQQLHTDLIQVFRLVSNPASDRRQVAASAGRAAAIADRLAQTIAGHQFDPTIAFRLMKSISADAASISGQGEKTAEQAAMVLQSLYIGYGANTPNANELLGAINGLFQQLNDPSGYLPSRFAGQLQKVNGLLR
jgi:hypothetical protein